MPGVSPSIGGTIAIDVTAPGGATSTQRYEPSPSIVTSARTSMPSISV